MHSEPTFINSRNTFPQYEITSRIFPLPFCLFLNSNVIVIMFMNLHNNYCVTFRRLNNGKNFKLIFLSKAMHTRRSLHYRMIYMPLFNSSYPSYIFFIFFLPFLCNHSVDELVFNPQEPTRSKEISQEIYFSLLLLCLNLSTRCVFFCYLLLMLSS